jgi:phytoene dehydrogenase-like protein
MIESGRVTGVLVNGERRAAEAVIIASDTMSAVNALFAVPPQDEWIQNMKRDTRGTTCTFACIGVRADLKERPHQIAFPLKRPIYCAGEAIQILGVNNYAAHNGYAPEGGTALTSFFGETDSYDWWRKARDNGTYTAEKQKLADSLIEELGGFIPAVKNSLDVVEIATPLTWERYTASWHGSWMTSMGVGAKMVTYPCVLREGRGVFFAGQRTQPPGGLPVALTSGRRAVQLLCRETDTVFEGAMR